MRLQKIQEANAKAVQKQAALNEQYPTLKIEGSTLTLGEFGLQKTPTYFLTPAPGESLETSIKNLKKRGVELHFISMHDGKEDIAIASAEILKPQYDAYVIWKLSQPDHEHFPPLDLGDNYALVHDVIAGQLVYHTQVPAGGSVDIAVRKAAQQGVQLNPSHMTHETSTVAYGKAAEVLSQFREFETQRAIKEAGTFEMPMAHSEWSDLVNLGYILSH